jgi:acyl-CoA synthetase (AMP-forming)/AMP-acid ligase II
MAGDGLRTGDLGYLRDGELFWVGRVQERMNVRGRKLDPSEFERTLLRVQDLRHGCFAVFGVDDRRLGTQRPVLVSELRGPATRPYQDIVTEIRAKVIEDLGIVLDDILLVGPGRLPKTSSGKRRHRHFRDLYLQGRLEQVSNNKIAACPSESTSG